ncbi:MAG: HzsA-related protein [Planctomycetota bacterium]
MLESDWLFQADDQPLDERAGREIVWARELAARIVARADKPDVTTELAELDKLQKRLESFQGLAPDPATARDVYLSVRRVKHRIMFKNPLLDFSSVLFIDQPYPQGQEWPHEARHRNGMMAMPGGRLLILDGLHPAGRVRKLAPHTPGSFWRPDVSFDAGKVLFCFKPHHDKAFHLYEIDADGSGLRQLTFGDYDDIDPIYLPDGHIMFSTSRCNTYIRCGPYIYSYVLARCDGDGKNVYIISHNNECDWLPTLLNDGRVIYSRWEYTDKALWRVQSLWTTNPDGTNTTTFWGNQSVWPDHVAQPRPIPNSRRIVFLGVGHHDWFAGCVGIIDPARGFNFPDGLTKVTADLPWPEVGNGPLDPVESPLYHSSGRYEAYQTPYPLSREYLLVSARRSGQAKRRTGRGTGGKFRLYLMDIHGNRELIYEGAHHVWHAIPLKRRRRPAVQPDRVAWPGTGRDRKQSEMGLLYSSNVYQGVPDLPRGIVKYLRVISLDYKTYTTWNKTHIFSGPAISMIQEDGVKRILGTVPVAPDGSVAFKAPPGRALHFQLLDEHYRALQTMRSFTGVMPAERRGCVGCHELHSAAPVNHAGLALQRPPSGLTPPPWGDKSISYERFVQPVLDRYCGQCHQGSGEARDKLDLTLRPGRHIFKEPYVTLVGPRQIRPRTTVPDRIPLGLELAGCFYVEGYNANDPQSLKTVRPLTTLSYTSRLIDIAMNGRHNGVKVDPLSLRRLIAWVDTNCTYRGDQDVKAIPDPNFPGIDQLPVRPRCRTAPVVLRP